MNALCSTFGSYSANPFSPSHQLRLPNTTDFCLFSDGQLNKCYLTMFPPKVEIPRDFLHPLLPHCSSNVLYYMYVAYPPHKPVTRDI